MDLDDSGRFAGVTITSIRKVELQSVEDQSDEGEDSEGESSENVTMDFTLILKIGG